MTTKVSNDMLGDDSREFTIALRGPASNGTYPVLLNAQFGFDITGADFQTDTGTITAKFTIEGVDVEFDGGDESLSLSITADSEMTDSAFTVDAGDTVLLVLSGAASSPTLATIDLHCRKAVSS